MNRVAVVGGGSWGTALAFHLAGLGLEVSLWVYEPELAEVMRVERENKVFLPGFRLDDSIDVTNRMDRALDRKRLVLTVMPSHVCRSVAERMLPHVNAEAVLVSATKGLEQNTQMRMTRVLADVLGGRIPRERIAAISGPSFAREVAAGHPTAIVIAAENHETAAMVQQTISGGRLRLYTESDVVGVELGGAVKNVIAIAAGVVRGLGYGHNTVAALITRGLVEMERLAVALGARRGTLAGLSGMGDLVLTCTGELSRNRQLGMKLARGMTLDEALSGTVAVAEGVRNTRCVLELAETHDVDMPITRQMDGILHRGVNPQLAIATLMERRLRPERE